MHALLLAALLGAAPLVAEPDLAPERARTPRAAQPASGSVVLPGLVLLGLAAAALVLARRRRVAGGPRLVEVLESASLGPRRSLVVARVGEETLVLGVSEGGISLLLSRPSVPTLAPRPAAEAPPKQFHALFTESVEDLELRRKLQQGGAGSVR